MKKLKVPLLSKKQNKERFSNTLVFLFIFLLPTQFGKFFFQDYSFVSGIRIDYLAPAIYLIDIFAILLVSININSLVVFFRNRKVQLALLILLLPVLFSKLLTISIFKYLKIIEFSAVLALFNKKNINRKIIWGAFAAGAVFEAVLAILQFVNKQSLQGIFYFFGERYLTLSMPAIAKASFGGVEFLRAYGTFSHPNSMAGFYLLIYLFALSSKRLNDSSLIKNLILASSTLVIFLTLSKFIIFSFLLINVIIFLRDYKKSECKFCLISKLFTLIILSYVFTLAKSDPGSLAKRAMMTGRAIELISKNFLFGTGLGTYTLFESQPVHNIFLLFFTEVGLLVGGILLFLLAASLWRVKNNSLLTIILAVIVWTGLFDHYWLTLNQNWLAAAVILGQVTNAQDRA